MSERIAGILFRIRADTTALRTGMNQANGAISSLLKSVNTLGGAFGIAFGGYTLKKIGETFISLVELGGQIKGITEAFDKLNEPYILKNLKTATRGLVDDLDLMKMVIKAENFGIPLRNLALYFEFATKRATQTGESVQDLIDIIISGIGKQSMKVVKSIGLSVDDWKKSFKETGSFVKTATEMMSAEIEKMGEVTKTEAQNVLSIKIAWQNVRDAIALELTEGGGINKSLGEFSEKLNDIADFMGTDKFDKLIEGFAKIWKWANLINTEYQMTIGLLRGWYLLITKIGDIGGGKQVAIPVPGKEATLNVGTISKPVFDFVPPVPEDYKYEGEKPDYTEHIPNLSGWDFYLDTEGYKDAIKSIEEDSKHFMSIFQGIEKELFDFSDMIRSTFLEIGNILGDAIESAFAGESFEDIGKEALKSMGRFMKQMGAMMLAYGLAALKFKTALLDPIGLIAAGAAMIAIGAAISGLASRGTSGGGGGGSSFMQTRHGGTSMSTINVQTESIVKGNDIYFVNKRFGRYHDNVT